MLRDLYKATFFSFSSYKTCFCGKRLYSRSLPGMSQSVASDMENNRDSELEIFAISISGTWRPVSKSVSITGSTERICTSESSDSATFTSALSMAVKLSRLPTASISSTTVSSRCFRDRVTAGAVPPADGLEMGGGAAAGATTTGRQFMHCLPLSK